MDKVEERYAVKVDGPYTSTDPLDDSRGAVLCSSLAVRGGLVATLYDTGGTATVWFSRGQAVALRNYITAVLDEGAGG